MVNFPGVNFIVGLAKDYVFRRGKHHYKFSIVTSCAPSKAFGMLKSPGMSAPGAPQAIDGKYQVELMGGNWVTQDVSDANMLNGGSEIETLSVADHSLTTAINLTGNEFANNIYGNNGANTLNGGGSNDAMIGFGGNDIFIVDNAADVAFDFAGQGNDIVYALTSYMCWCTRSAIISG